MWVHKKGLEVSDDYNLAGKSSEEGLWQGPREDFTLLKLYFTYIFNQTTKMSFSYQPRELYIFLGDSIIH